MNSFIGGVARNPLKARAIIFRAIRERSLDEAKWLRSIGRMIVLRNNNDDADAALIAENGDLIE